MRIQMVILFYLLLSDRKVNRKMKICKGYDYFMIVQRDLFLISEVILSLQSQSQKAQVRDATYDKQHSAFRTQNVRVIKMIERLTICRQLIFEIYLIQLTQQELAKERRKAKRRQAYANLSKEQKKNRNLKRSKRRRDSLLFVFFFALSDSRSIWQRGLFECLSLSLSLPLHFSFYSFQNRGSTYQRERNGE